ncbi:hypothetical protein BGW36DRAFT_301985 [Talaromyces proteolyticus]|uniref:Zn(2)-C6 fungal-type domain-containing protein n=1 Tax=Talaromyces proteolyticus TaxID=1131652 RepID=A0AAD4KJQ1_9EURO|nr:uncharacterized protein BGW36DRAFT_301985 [Talaromyces proteolyticus]KAH8693169.1 hypothetical protein BGW36DRAFT_301985 [Talaromyces proteolyticus]
MGRKPHPLVLEFFTRGPKLEDASNRYQYNCKACGEKFPKGRIDSLINHLVKKCQAISMPVRQSVVMRVHDLPALDDSDPNKAAVLARLQKGAKSELPYSTRPAFDGLNVLAEASRQVGASDQTKRGPKFTQSMTVGGKTVMIDPALEAEAFQAQGEVTDEAMLAGVAAAASMTPTPSAPGDQALSDSPSMAQTQNDSLSVEPTTTGAQSSSQLSLIAASASEMASQSLAMDAETGSLADGLPRLGQPWPDHQLSSTDQYLLESLQASDPSLTATQRAVTYPRPIAMNPNTSSSKGPFINDFGSPSKPSRPKVRGRFSADRRKEVQEVRKRGACIRCRMLKKPCSGESPCNTCASVESARLWKQPCIRTRLVEEFELYGAGLHTTLAYHDVNSTKAQGNFENYVGRIEAAHMDDSPLFVTFAGSIGHKAGLSAIDPQLRALVDDGQFSGSAQEMYMLDNDSDDLPGKLEVYIKKMAPSFIEAEPSGFMKQTLVLASQLAQDKKDLLLDRALELWYATHVLVDSELQWKLYYNSTLPPTATNTLAPSSDEGRVLIDRNANVDSYNLLCSQLRGAVEKRAGQLSKVVMNDLERRLLQRQHTGWFETFLVAVILLNCVERACWLFTTWEDESFAGRWPLDKRPQYYASQGDRFSDILHMLLRMRSLPPKTVVDTETGLLKAVENSDNSAILWFDTIQLSLGFLEQRQLAQFDAQNSRCFELKYASKILKPAPI